MTSAASRTPTSSSAILAWTHGFASQAISRPSTAASQSKAQRTDAMPWLSTPERGASALPAARLLPARPRPPRPPDRHRRQRPQARLPVLVHAHPRRGLRLWPAVVDQEEAGPPRAHRRRPEGPRDHRDLVDEPAMRHAERALAQQAELAYKRNVADWQATRPAKAARARHRGTHLESPQRAKAAWQTTAPDVCASLRQSLAPNAHDPTAPRRSATPLDFHPSRKGSARTLPAPCRDAIRMESDSSFRLASWRRALAVAIGSASNLGFAPRVERRCRRRGRATSGARS